MPHHSPLELKKKLRLEVRAKRRLLSTRYRDAASLKVIECFKQISLNSPPKIATGFFHQDGELNIEPLMDYLGQQECQIAVPVIDFSTDQMQFQLLNEQSTFELNQFGIKEPVWDPSFQIKPDCIDLVLYPLVAFDAKRHRLGMGGGYYDKYFSYLHAKASDGNADIVDNNKAMRCAESLPILIGCAFECQQVEAVPIEPWDIGLDYVITESRVY
jgi:5-formyltetrahydrofolate cyclo-ligase